MDQAQRVVITGAAGLSAQDAVDLVRAAVESADLDGFVVANGISANRYRAADLSAALDLGYQPQDDAWATGRSPARCEQFDDRG